MLSAQSRRRERPESCQQFLVNLGIACDDIGTQRVLGAGGRADAAAGFLNQQRPGRGVPGRQSEFPKTVDASGRHIGKIQRCRPRPAHTGRGGHNHLEHGEILIDMGAGTKRKTGADQRAFQGALRADPDFLALELRAVAARSGEEFLPHGIVDHGVLQAALVLERDRHREGRETMQKIRGAVERIDDPDELVVAAAPAFLGEERVLRVAAADGGDDVGFGLAVDLGHEIVAALAVDFQGIEARKAAHDQVTGASGGAHAGIEQGLHNGALEKQSMTALVRIVLIDPSHPGNIGSVARAMKNMAVTDLVLVRPRSFPHAEANALAAGADDILTGARIVSTVAEAISDCGFIAGTTSRPRSYYWEFTTPRDVAGRIVGLPEENRAALLFGSERYGLATEDLNHCNVLVRIPANPEYCSLNLAMSVQLMSYEIFMSREHPQSRTQLELPLAPSGDVEHFYAHLHQVLNEIDFDDRTGHLMERLRRLFNRAQLDRNELNILRGILSAVQGRRGQSAQRPRTERGGGKERD